MWNPWRRHPGQREQAGLPRPTGRGSDTAGGDAEPRPPGRGWELGGDPAGRSSTEPSAVDVATVVLVRPPTGLWDPPGAGPGGATAQTERGTTLAAGTAGREAAAEIGMYVGAALVGGAVVAVVVRGWPTWSAGLHAAVAAAGSVGLVALALLMRGSLRGACSARRRRAVSTLLTTGVGIATAEAVGVATTAQAAPWAVPATLAAAATLFAAVCATARSALSESAVLVSLVLLLVTGAGVGQVSWLVVLALGALWAALGVRHLKGRRTALVAGTVVALVGGVAVASGPWAWPARAAFTVIGVASMMRFLRGASSFWLGLGAGCATALGVTVASDAVGPMLAMLCGGAATMGTSWVALRRGTRPVQADAGALDG